MINPRVARYMLAKHGRAGLPGLVHDNLADLGVTPRALDVEEEGEGVAPTAIAEADQGQLDVPPQAAMEGAQPEELDAFPQPFSAPPTVEAQAPVVASRAAAESDDEDETADARQRDRTSAIARGIETAGRQFVAGMTRTPILDTLTQQTNQAGEVRTAAKTRAEQLRAAAEEARRSRLDSWTLEDNEASRIEKLARAAALSREKRTGTPADPTLPREKFEQQKVVDALKDERERARIAKMGLKGAGGGAKLSPTALGDLADFGVAEAELDRLGQAFGKFGVSGIGGKAGSVATNALGLQNTDAAAYGAEARRVMQSVGKILEGGKLAAGDEVKYAKMLPQAGDPPEQARRKIEGLKTMLRDARNRRERELAAGGYKVPQGDKDEPETITVSNGKETYEVEPGDLADAERDGFKRVK